MAKALARMVRRRSGRCRQKNRATPLRLCFFGYDEWGKQNHVCFVVTEDGYEPAPTAVSPGTNACFDGRATTAAAAGLQHVVDW